MRSRRSGAGEILLTSMDRDGTKAGFDVELTRAIADAVPIPVIASGGVGTLEHLVDGVRDGHANAVLAASIFHFGTYSIAEAKAYMAKAGLAMRLRSLGLPQTRAGFVLLNVMTERSGRSIHYRSASHGVLALTARMPRRGCNEIVTAHIHVVRHVRSAAAQFIPGGLIPTTRARTAGPGSIALASRPGAGMRG